MILSIEKPDKTLISLEIESSYSVADAKALLEVETEIQNDRIVLKIKSTGVELLDAQVFSNLHITKDTVLIMSDRTKQAAVQGGSFSNINFQNILQNATSSLQRPQGQQPLDLRAIIQQATTNAQNNFSNILFNPNPLQFKMQAQRTITEYHNNPSELRMLQFHNPGLYEIINNRDVDTLSKVLLEQHQESTKKQRVEASLRLDPNNESLKKELDEIKREEEVLENRQLALEYMPEIFSRITMLYIDCEVNGHRVKALIDTGAQITSMSSSFAVTTNVIRLVDKQFKGTVAGVGTSNLIGQVHMAQIKIGKDFYPSSLSIIENLNTDVIIGLDMLKRHQCVVNLKDHYLEIGNERVEFVSEREIQEEMIKKMEEKNMEKSVEKNVDKKIDNKEQESIKTLMELGATEDQAKMLYQMCNGNVEAAGALLLQM